MVRTMERMMLQMQPALSNLICISVLPAARSVGRMIGVLIGQLVDQAYLSFPDRADMGNGTGSCCE